jgi:hypothetical protein
MPGFHGDCQEFLRDNLSLRVLLSTPLDSIHKNYYTFVPMQMQDKKRLFLDFAAAATLSISAAGTVTCTQVPDAGIHRDRPET